MLEVSLPVQMIRLFKMTCRNYVYSAEDGIIQIIISYKKGVIHGDCFGYRPCGTLYCIEKWKSGKLFECTKYTIDGTVYQMDIYEGGSAISGLYYSGLYIDKTFFKLGFINP